MEGVEFKVVKGRDDLLLLVNGTGGVPEVHPPERERDKNELHRFVIGRGRLLGGIPGTSQRDAMRGAELLSRCCPYVLGERDGAEWDEEANALLDEIEAYVEEVGP